LYKEINAPTDVRILQEVKLETSKLELWEETWGIKFSIEKCMILKHNLHITEYTLHGKKIISVTNAK